ncbi:MAG: SUMF1/EgtB/PvdO family nonheme iron enzyme [Pseudomonadota bacterium]
MKEKQFRLVLAFGLASFVVSAAEAEVGDEIRFCDDCPVFVEVPAPPEDLRQIRYVAKFELTWKDYLKSVTGGDCTMPKNLSYQLAPEPEIIERMSIDWTVGDLNIHQIQCFANWVGRHTDLKIDLPETEEWKWFARAGTEGRYPWGDEANKEMAMVRGTKSFSIHGFSYGLMFDRDGPYPEGGPVGQFAPNNFGLFDIIGNHAELSKSAVDTHAYFKTKGLEAPQFKGRLSYPVLGGSYMNKIEDARIDRVKWSFSSPEGEIVTSVAVRLIAYSDR